MEATIETVRQQFAEPPATARPMMRWWWFGPDVDRTELDRELTAMATAGLGGFEVAFVYPLSQVSSPFLSDAFLADVSFAAGRARELGLRFDLTVGSGWPFGGPHITPDLVARRLAWTRTTVAEAAARISLEPPDGGELVAAYLRDPGAAVGAGPRLTEIVDGAVTVAAASAGRVLLAAWSCPTGQQVKRAAAGAEGPVLDHYSADATRRHIEQVAAPLLAAAGAHRVGSVFCDSMEVYGADWTPALPWEFERRRGYPLLPRLGELADGSGHSTLRADVLRTLSELYEENFVAVFRDWANGQGVPFRIQSYGEPPATLSSYRSADLSEGEGWGWDAIPETRWAAAGAHLHHADPVVSAEIWTWVHSPSSRAAPLDLVGEAHEHLLAGVNQFVGHGWPYSPPDAAAPGWLFYAAGALDDRNPWWPAMPHLARYLQRLCWLLRQGRRVADVLLYVPARDVYARMGPHTGGTSINLWRETTRHIGPVVPRAIRRTGFDFTLFDDDAVEVTDPASVPVVVLPFALDIPAGTRRWLDAVQAAGGVVLDLTRDDDLDALVERLSAACPPDVSINPAAPSLGFVHRRLDDGAHVYLVANTGAERIEGQLRVRDGSNCRIERWDPRSGAVRCPDAGVPAAISLDPCEAAVFVAVEVDDVGTDQQPEDVRVTEAGRIELTGLWTTRFGDSDDHEPVTVPHVWESDPRRRDFSGTATYLTTFPVREVEQGSRVLLDFGSVIPSAGTERDPGVGGARSYRAPVTAPVREIAQVAVNGVDCGVVWGPPYEVDITDAVVRGTNDLRLVVANTGAGALAVGVDALTELVAGVEERYGRRFEMQELDRAREGVVSGLATVPSIVVRRPNGQNRRHGPSR